MTNSQHALTYIRDGMIVGLGTGAASTAFIHALGDAVKAGLKVQGVPTSDRSEALAKELGIPLLTLEQCGAQLDVCVDGADEFDPRLDLVKGLGGALVREKIVAASAKMFVVLVGPADVAKKRAKQQIGERGDLPVEVVPFALPLVERKLKEMGLSPVLRKKPDGATYLTDNGNAIFDKCIKPVDDMAKFEQTLLAIPGVVGTGLFLNMADIVLVQDGDKLEVLTRQ